MQNNTPLNKIRVRFAPSPTGFVHIGNLRTLLYGYLFAKKMNGTVVLRIEDTDQSRFVDGAIPKLLETLTWAGLSYDEGIEKGGDFGPYIQSERLELYKKCVQELIEKGSAYWAFDTSEELEAMRKRQTEAKMAPMYERDTMKNQFTLGDAQTKKLLSSGVPRVARLKMPDDKTIVLNDVVRGRVEFDSRLIDDQILLKSDGFPTYHLAVVVDDHFMHISHVIRGEEWLSSTPKHLLLYEAFGWEAPQFAHLPLLLNPDKSKLSKRTGDVAVEAYIQKGYLPQALLNFIVLLGWNPKTEQEFFTLEEMIQVFDLGKIHKSGAVVDWKRLNWFNSYYIKKMNQSEFLEYAKPFLKDVHGDQLRIESLALLHKDRLQFFAELKTFVEPFVELNETYVAADLVWKKSTQKETLQVFDQAIRALSELPEEKFSIEHLTGYLRQTAEKMGLPAGNFFWPLRYALSGSKTSPGVFELVWALQKDETLHRLMIGKQKLQKVA